ncbi:MAG: hypothetical protein ACQETE_11615 [Bacteroidota bacterium]
MAKDYELNPSSKAVDLILSIWIREELNMEQITWTLIIWQLAIGLFVGGTVGRFIEWEGISFYANIIWGAFSAVITGNIAVIFGIGDGVLYAMLGTVAVLFLVNVFHQHHEEDFFGDIKHDIKIKYQ